MLKPTLSFGLLIFASLVVQASERREDPSLPVTEGLVLWLDAQMLPTSNDQPVEEWKDRRGVGIAARHEVGGEADEGDVASIGADLGSTRMAVRRRSIEGTADERLPVRVEAHHPTRT